MIQPRPPGGGGPAPPPKRWFDASQARPGSCPLFPGERASVGRGRGRPIGRPRPVGLQLPRRPCPNARAAGVREVQPTGHGLWGRRLPSGGRPVAVFAAQMPVYWEPGSPTRRSFSGTAASSRTEVAERASQFALRAVPRCGEPPPSTSGLVELSTETSLQNPRFQQETPGRKISRGPPPTFSNRRPAPGPWRRRIPACRAGPRPTCLWPGALRPAAAPRSPSFGPGPAFEPTAMCRGSGVSRWRGAFFFFFRHPLAGCPKG